MSVLDRDAVRRLYDKRASHYDLAMLGFRILGFHRRRIRLLETLALSRGDTVVDLCCGTGLNLPHLSRTVGTCGRVIAVVLSAGMLDRARERVDRVGLRSVEFMQSDVREFDFPHPTDAIVSTFGLEMVPGYETVVADATGVLSAGGRFGLLGLKHPDGWPGWLVDLGVAATAAFGVSRDYEEFRPWVAADVHLNRIFYREYLAGAAYSYTGTV